MADIIPAGSTLPSVFENIDVSQTFTAQLGVGESIVSINIIDSRPNAGITVNGSTFIGQYRDSFSLATGAIKARLRNTGELKGYDSWESLPPPTQADIYEWNAPSVLTTNYTYTVELKYLFTPAVEPGLPPPTPVEKSITKTYTQQVRGNYNVWAIKLREYVKASGALPKWQA